MRRSSTSLVLSSLLLAACGGAPEPAAPTETRVAARAPTAPPPAPKSPPAKSSLDPETPIPVLEPAVLACDPLGYCTRRTPSRRSSGFEAIAGIWGTSPTDLYVFGEHGFMVRYDGKTLTAVPARTFRAGDVSDVWGTSATDVYAVTGRGVFHFDGTTWTDQAGPRAGRIVGRATNDFWVTEYGAIVRREGTGWTNKSIGGAVSFADAWESGPRDGYAVGEAGLFYHFDGAAWSKVATGLPEKRGFVVYRAVWGSGPSDVFVAGVDTILHFDGKAWAAQPLPRNGADVIAIRGTGPSDVYALGARGVLSHYDGASWTALADVSLGAADARFSRLWMASPSDLWLSGKDTPLVRLERTFVEEQSGTDKDLFGVAGADGEVFAVGAAGAAVHSVGGKWKPEPTGTKNTLRDVWIGSRTDGWAVGDAGTIVRWDGKGWKMQASPTKEDLLAVAAAGQKVVAVGKKGTVVVFDGKKWALEASHTTVDLLGVAAAQGDDDLVAVGDAGTVVRARRGASGRELFAETVSGAGKLRAVWLDPARGSGAAIANVCDAEGATFRASAAKWDKIVERGAGVDIRGAVRIGASTWAAGARGLVHVSSGKATLPWLGDVLPPKKDVFDAWGTDEKDVLLVGKGGLVVRRRRP